MSGPHTRLNEAMTARSLEIKKRWKKIADEAGISTSALGQIRRGEYKPSPHTARALEDALEWTHGSIDRILDGGTAVPRSQDPVSTEPRSRSVMAELTERVENDPELARAVLELLRRAGSESPGRSGRGGGSARDIG